MDLALVAREGVASTVHVQKSPKNVRVRNGCLTCRKRKKKCKGGPPECGDCLRLNRVCTWETPQDLVGNGALAVQQTAHVLAAKAIHSGSIDRAPNPLQFWTDQNASEATVAARRLTLRYFTETFTYILTTNVANNGFLNMLMPMAVESPPLLNAVVAWASSHLALFHKPFKTTATKNRNAAIKSLLAYVSGQTMPEITLACCMVLCSMDAILGDTEVWFTHLRGASGVLQDAFKRDPDALSRSSEGRWLLRNFAYHDILMSVSMNRAPLMPGSYWLSGADVVDSYFGLASVPMAGLSSISSLNATMMEYNQYFAARKSPCEMLTGNPATWTSGTAPDFSSEIWRIEMQLQNWVCASSLDPSLMHLAESYRAAALIHLYRVIRQNRQPGYQDLNQRIQKQVEAIVCAVNQMPLSCLPECTLLFPLFMAGGEAEDDEHIRCVRDRMQSLARSRQFQNVDVALEALEALWAERQVQNHEHNEVRRSADWLHILFDWGWKLPLS